MALDNRLIMLRYESGERVVITPSKEALTPESILFVLDEKNNAVWTWLGKKTSNIDKRGAARIAHGLRSSGYTYREHIVAPQAEKLIVIDENNLKDPEVKVNFELLNDTLSKAQLVDDYLANIPYEGPVPIKKAEITDFKPDVGEVQVESPPQQVQPLTAQPVEPPSKPEIKKEDTKASQLEDDSVAEVKAGLLLYATLKQFSEIYAILKDKEVRIEGAVEPLAKFTIKGKELSVSPELKFAGQQEAVLEVFRELFKKTKL
ncbi:MAG: hypothetical protein ACTSYO_03200 [Candidatus Ranarchaeia archaeon]